jgi:hypothetical protein
MAKKRLVTKKKRRRAKGLGTVYRRGQLWSIAWVANGVKQYEHGFPDEDTARQVAVRVAESVSSSSSIRAARAPAR